MKPQLTAVVGRHSFLLLFCSPPGPDGGRLPRWSLERRVGGLEIPFGGGPPLSKYRPVIGGAEISNDKPGKAR